MLKALGLRENLQIIAFFIRVDIKREKGRSGIDFVTVVIFFNTVFFCCCCCCFFVVFFFLGGGVGACLER